MYKQEENKMTNADLNKLTEMLNIETLETQNNDDADFQELAVWKIKAALEAAYEMGKNAK